jgi:hypothetical protein
MVMAETVRQLQINAAVVAGLVVVQRTQRPFFFFSSRRLNKQKSMGWLTAGLGVWCQDQPPQSQSLSQSRLTPREGRCSAWPDAITICCRDVIQRPSLLELSTRSHDYRQTWTVLVSWVMGMTNLLQIQQQLARTHTQTLPFSFIPKLLSCSICPQQLTLL